jgi:hypothetical protein
MFIMLLNSCDDNDYSSFVPTYKGFSFSVNGKSVEPTSIYAGDTVTVIAVQNKLGHLINKTKYSWTVQTDTITCKPIQVGPYSVGVYDDNNINPYVTFVVPDTQKEVYVSFSASFSFSGTGVTSSTSATDGGTYDGNIYTIGSAALYGAVKGSVSFLPKSR